ncbi:thiopurine S-methyltransferase [Roseovarius salis]|uniref:thiopurine S-methyltransferase n=1 Tax=Roseovarius salis TaxID=3376063 RepID=UPI0037CAF80C
MDAQFWHERWQTGQIGFHEGHVNRMLKTYINRLQMADGARVFLPLCGKTRDIAWLKERGYRVVGSELSGIAIAELFDEMELAPEVTGDAALRRHAAGGVEVFEGDFFALTPDTLGPVHGVFDRAALVALPQDLRQRYARQMIRLTAPAPQLLVTFVYDTARMDGPPFSVEETEIRELYGAEYGVEMLDDLDVPGGLKGICPARAQAWLLTAR